MLVLVIYFSSDSCVFVQKISLPELIDSSGLRGRWFTYISGDVFSYQLHVRLLLLHQIYFFLAVEAAEAMDPSIFFY
jgi:hypothetical protein